MGTMMEIGLAQQRLFDDDHQVQYEPANSPAEFHESESNAPYGENANQEYMARNQAFSTKRPPETPAHDSIPRVEIHGTAPSDDWSQSAPSYNIFESSNQTPSNQLNRADFLRDSGAITQPEPVLNFELRRWTSMQGAASSPHDTEPFSSVISPKTARVKSDSLVPNTILPTPSINELALPATIQIPKIEKRGRKKKQALPLNDEDDELFHTALREATPNKPEKRKPGRPSKNANVKSANPVPAERSYAPSHLSGDTTIAATLQAPSEDSATYDNVSPQALPASRSGDFQTISLDENSLEQDMQPPPKLAKEPGRKKLKRGKITSVTLTKAFESDVEDDVIWIDERPIVPTGREDRPNPEQAEVAPTPAPKKRGRKRKKTTEQLDQEAKAGPQADPTIYLEKASNQEELEDTHQKAGVSVVLSNSTRRPQNPDISNPDPIPEDDTSNNEPQVLQPSTTPTKDVSNNELAQPPETPSMPTTDPKTPSGKGPGKHSPISSTCKVPYRVGLSKRARIAPLLKIIKR
ncbi:hypothetical protein ASPCAL12611 [Aspergillus calidoustus]|uniref:Uncharacterized protein n=1 Tax=Aspergillus calidoustus TaxID=454130 RepID=A0A0U5H651_ASPCI|nr:hypothetical protein ASPCAL12611 [Aspergillus calidoustus]